MHRLTNTKFLRIHEPLLEALAEGTFKLVMAEELESQLDRQARTMTKLSAY
jgi:hypothetical protein